MALVGDMNYLTIDGDTYEIADAEARNDILLKAPLASPDFTGTPTAPTAASGDSSTQIATTAFVQDAMSGAGAGTVTSVGVSNATNGGLSVSGSPITTNGTITVGHSNVLSSAQSTQAVYPIKIDKNGHISEYGSAVTSMPASDVSAWAKEATKPTYTYSEVGAAASSHTHGNITNGGDITATAPTIASGDQIIINDNSASKITNGPTFDGSTTTKALTQKGTWETFLQSESDPVFSASAAAVITSGDITNWNGKTSNTGTVTSVRVQATSPVQSSTSTEQTTSLNTTISLADAYGDTKNPYGTKTAKYVLAGPASGSDAAPSFRALVASDIPDLSSTYLTSESDPVFSTSAAAGITSTDISNWNAKSDTDEKMKWTASTSSNTYYPLQSTSTATTSTANTLNGINFYQYYNTAGGYRRLNLGNATSWKSSGGAYGTIRLYGAAATYYGDLVPGTLGTTSGDGHISANRTWTLPDKTGTVALTSDIPATPTATESATTGISIANHGTGTVTGVQSSTTSVRGVKTGTSSTTTASKASGGNSTVPTLGDPISIIGVQSSTTSVTGVQSSTTTASKVTVGTSSTDYGVTAAGSGSFTSGAFNGGSGSFTATVTSHVLSFSHTHTAATHGADSHTHTAPTLGSKVPTVSASDVTVPIKATSATTVPIKATSATEIPNVTSVGSASTWSFTDVTVPIRADSDTTVPIKDASASTFVTGTTHTITDNGHTHSI